MSTHIMSMFRESQLTRMPQSKTTYRAGVQLDIVVVNTILPRALCSIMDFLPFWDLYSKYSSGHASWSLSM